MTRRLSLASGALAAFVSLTGAAQAQSGGDFYKGKDLTILVGSGAGGGYDTTARILIRHIGKYIPGNPTFLVQNMPGAAGVAAMNHVVNNTPKDGLTIGISQSGTSFEPLFHQLSPGGNTAKFDGTKLNWIGSVEEAIYFFAFWNSSPVHTFDDLLKQEAVVGATSANSDEGLFSTLLNNMFHTKLKLITGYKSAGEVRLAVERGELQGNLNTYSSLMNGQPTWITEKKVRIPIQLTLTPFAPLGNVPMALDILKSEEDKRVLEVILAKSKLARPFVMADGVPAERVAIIRKAFVEVTKDPEFVAEANKTGINVNPVLADEVQKTVARVYATPEALLQRVRQMVGVK